MTIHRRASKAFYCLLTAISFIIIVPTLCITLAVRSHPTGDLWSEQDSDSKDGVIYLTANIISVDIQTTTMVVEWSIYGGTCDDNLNCTDVNIFFDTNLSHRRDDSDSYSNSRPTDPTFIFNHNMTDLQANFRIFRTDHILTNPFGYDWKFSPASLVYYPFDCYTAEIHAFAQNVVTNQSVPLKLTSLSGLVPGLKITNDTSSDSPKDAVPNTGVTIQRSTLVIGYCLIITVTFWLVTLMICLIMISTVVFGFKQRNEIVVVPIGTVFAFTELRSTMPGAPEGFGDILDFAGLLPCLVLLSICAVTMAGIYLFADPNDPARRPFTWEEMRNMAGYYVHHIKMDPTRDSVTKH